MEHQVFSVQDEFRVRVFSLMQNARSEREGVEGGGHVKVLSLHTLL